jgi:hypothetical protein
MYLFSGSWFEKVDTLDELYSEISNITPCEAMVRCFNILCPFDKELPRMATNEDKIDLENAWKNFNGVKWYEEDPEAFRNRKGELENIEELNKYEREI